MGYYSKYIPEENRIFAIIAGDKKKLLGCNEIL